MSGPANQTSKRRLVCYEFRTEPISTLTPCGTSHVREGNMHTLQRVWFDSGMAESNSENGYLRYH